MAFGGHFFTDVAAAGLVTFFVIWLAYGYIYRWPRTRLTDEGVDAALTRFAWPAFAWRRRLINRQVPPKPTFVHRIVQGHAHD
jgi:membrane-associated phospholipid phosphatase